MTPKNFTKPIAYIQLPFHVKAQIHGNWVSAERLGQPEMARDFVGKVDTDFVKGKSALDFIQYFGDSVLGIQGSTSSNIRACPGELMIFHNDVEEF